MSRLHLLLLTLLWSCQTTTTEKPADSRAHSNHPFSFQVKASFQTEAVSADPEADAADDPAIWHNDVDPELSLIFGSDKTNGVDIFDMQGKRKTTHLVGRINNIDLRKEVLGNLDILGGSHRDSIGIFFWTIDQDSLDLNYLGWIPSELPDVYGFCMYKQPQTGRVFAYVNSKTGKVEQWSLSLTDKGISGELIRELQLPGQVEGMVADDSLEVLFIGVEEDGIYRFGANPEDAVKGERIPGSGEENEAIRYDLEGLTIFYENGEKGYLIASSQGNNSYAVFERSGNNEYLGSFEIIEGAVDGAQETDGMDITHLPIGSAYPQGIFVVQDGFNYEGQTKVSQNFKVVNCKEILELIE